MKEDNENRKEGMQKRRHVLGLEHVAKKLFHFCVSNDFFKECFFDSVGVADAQIGEQHQKPSEARGVARRARFDVIS